MISRNGHRLFGATSDAASAMRDVIPETIDAIRALTGIVRDANESIAKTNAALGLDPKLI